MRWVQVAIVAGAVLLILAAQAQVRVVKEPPCRLDSSLDVPILQLGQCPAGMVGYNCSDRLDVLLSFLPGPTQWRAQWGNARSTRCQEMAMNALLRALGSAHDADFHIGGAVERAFVINDPKRPCTVGKMLHQFTVANHAALIREGAFTWQVHDDPDWRYTRNGTICSARGAGWFCIWRRFPSGVQFATEVSTPPVLLWPPSRVATGSALQYALMGAVMKALTMPSEPLEAYLRERVRFVCADGTQPTRDVCPGNAGPRAAVQIRHGDSCEGSMQAIKGPRNMMIREGQRKFRFCYALDVYLKELLHMRALYGVTTALLATDDPVVVRQVMAEPAGFNWVFVEWPRDQLARPKPWVEFRANLSEDVALSLGAELELLSHADVFVGSFGSQVGRSIYYRMLAHVRTGTLPPFASVDGYGLCCDFREDCAEADILRRERTVSECIRMGGSSDFLRSLPLQ